MGHGKWQPLFLSCLFYTVLERDKFKDSTTCKPCKSWVQVKILEKISGRGKEAIEPSGSTMDPDVIEIPPPIHHPPRFREQNKASSFHRFKVILHDVIDIDDDSEDVVIIGEKVNNSNKGKTIDAIHDDHQVVKTADYTYSLPAVENFGSVSGIASSNNFPSVSNNLINIDGHGSDLSYDDDDYFDILSEDYMDVDEYALLQKHFDNVDIPTGIEAPFTWLPPDYVVGSKKTGNNTLYPWHHMQSNANKSPMTPSSQPSLSLEPTNSEIQASSWGAINIPIKMGNVDHSSGVELSSQYISEPAPSKKSATSKLRGRTSNASLGVESSKSHWSSGPFHSKKKPASTYHGFNYHAEAAKMPHAGELPYWGQFKSAKKEAGSSISSLSTFIEHHGSLYPPGIESGKHWWEISHNAKPFSTHLNNIPNHIYYPFDPLVAHPEHVFDNNWVHDSARDGFNGKTVDGPIVTITDEAKEEILRKFRSFKQFDTVEDISDHHFFRSNSSMHQPPKNWAKKIQEEWRILEKDLPASIFVRVFESRMDLLRAVIIGAEGTPYHDGLFFFDVFFPSAYPNVPPFLNLGAEMRQIPRDGEFAYPYEAVLNFEDFVKGHFCSRASDILVACKAYMEGAQVGCLVKGGVQDVDEGDRSCSQRFKDSLSGYMNMLVKEFAKVGAKDIEKLLPPATTPVVNKPSGLSIA
ncbi:hypothetical protein JHK84_035023 [Glycine max]|nr:hypothetical protein JHK84_035023 [Glycine max]